MPRDHALADKGTWQSRHHQHWRKKLMPRYHALSGEGVWKSHPHQHCNRKPTPQNHALPEREDDKVVIISTVVGGSFHEITRTN